ncbi:hypothetical protein [Pseudotabrizicola sp. 4114]|uniref:hypothetical protein n=1 Tax=Pseudotabrizicola sp. 4114 TaxID=2817731 RepID=UPI0032B7D103
MPVQESNTDQSEIDEAEIDRLIASLDECDLPSNEKDTERGHIDPEYQKYLAEQLYAKGEAERKKRFEDNMKRADSYGSIEAPAFDSTSDASVDAIASMDRELEHGNFSVDHPTGEPEEIEDPKKIYDPVRLTAWDKAREKERKADERLAKLTPGTPEHDRAKWQADEALRLRKIEDERDGDPEWRKRRAADIWRAGEGKPEYNAGRRKVREKPNRDLSGLTQGEKDKDKKEQSKLRAAKAYERQKAEKEAAKDQEVAAMKAHPDYGRF